MADLNFNDVPKGSRIPAQIPLNVKEWSKDEATLAYLGVDDNLAFTYHDNIEVFCLAEKTLYRWREVQIGEENTGLVPVDFTYPDEIIVYDVDYSNKTYNFFPIEYQLVDNVITYTADNIGGGPGWFKNITGLTTQTLNFRTPISDSLLVTQDGDNLRFELPTSDALPDFIVNQDFSVTYDDWLKANKDTNLGVPVIGYQYKGFGTMAKPFIDTTVYVLNSPFTPPTITPNTSIQNGLDAYVGGGTKLFPSNYGSRVKVQKSASQYIFKGNLNYHGIKFNIESSTIVTHDPIATTGEDSWFINLDHSTITATSIIQPIIEIDFDGTLNLKRNGFKNKGTNLVTTNFIISKIVQIKNEGLISQTSNIPDGDTPGDYMLMDFNAVGTINYKNDGHAYATITGGVMHSTINPILKTGYHVTDFVNVEFSYGTLGGSVSAAVIPYENLLGAYTRMEKCKFYNFGNEGTTSLFKSTNVNSHFLIIEPLLNGTVTRLLEVTPHATDPSQDPSFTMYNAVNKDGFAATSTLFHVPLFGGRTAKWVNVYFNNNYLSKGSVDTTTVDLTQGNKQGVINFLGRIVDQAKNLVEFIPRFTSRASALVGGADKGTRFTKYTTVTSGSFVVGEEYKILTLGTTNFITEQGASSNAVGTWFVATVAGTGTGTADKEIVEIIT